MYAVNRLSIPYSAFRLLVISSKLNEPMLLIYPSTAYYRLLSKIIKYGMLQVVEDFQLGFNFTMLLNVKHNEFAFFVSAFRSHLD